MEELEKIAKELILAITEKTLKSLKNKGLLKEPSKLQMLCSSPEMTALIKKLSAPKYDPNRKFKKGDIVEPCQVKGRWHSVTWEGRSGIHFTVTEDEDEDGIVSIKDSDCDLPYIAAAVFFNLVTPVEELGPYSVRHNEAHAAWSIYGPFGLSAVNYFYGERYPYTQEQAKAAAEAERDRLNAEYRKEQSND